MADEVSGRSRPLLEEPNDEDRRARAWSSHRDNILASTWKSLVNVGVKERQSVTKAVYYSAVNIFILLVGGVAFALYTIFSAFLRPLLWAVLCGTFLYPVKSRGTRALRAWLLFNRTSGTPLLVALVLIPFQLLSACLDILEDVLVRAWQHLLGMAVLLIALYCFDNFPVAQSVGLMVDSVSDLSANVLNIVGENSLAVLTVVLAYLVAIAFCWDSALRQWLCRLSLPVWAVFLLYGASLFTAYRLPLFFTVAFLLVVGATSGMPVLRASDTRSRSGEHFPTGHDSTDGPGIGQKRQRGRRLRRSHSVSTFTTTFGNDFSHTLRHSAIYFKLLFWACVTFKFYTNLWLLTLLPAAGFLLLLKMVNRYFCLTKWFVRKLTRPGCVSLWMKRRSDALMPPPVRGLGRLIVKGDRKVSHWLEEFTDRLVSIVLIIALLVSALLLTFLLAVQVRYESVHIVEQTGTVLQEVANSFPEIQRWFSHELPGSVSSAVDALTSHAYLHGRQAICSWLKDLVAGQENATQLERQLLDTWDRLFNVWQNQSSARGQRVRGVQLTPTLTDQAASLQQVMRGIVSVNTSSLVAFGRRNLGMLQSVVDSVRTVLWGNFSFLFAVITSMSSVLMTSSTVVFNFLLHMVIFLSSLFYLLSLSKDQYQPLAWMISLLPPEAEMQDQAGPAVSAAIQGVFGATLKLVTFYGFFTYFTHSLFGFEIVIIPSVVAALFGAVPFVGTYWVAVPASLYLWLVDGGIFSAVLLISLHLLAVSFVDMAIYSEIKGAGHPYLTGLAVAGGVYVFGLDGAFIGPILLCCGLVALGIYQNILDTDKEDKPVYGRSLSHPGSRSDFS